MLLTFLSLQKHRKIPALILDAVRRCAQGKPVRNAGGSPQQFAREIGLGVSHEYSTSFSDHDHRRASRRRSCGWGHRVGDHATARPSTGQHAFHRRTRVDPLRPVGGLRGLGQHHEA